MKINNTTTLIHPPPTQPYALPPKENFRFIRIHIAQILYRIYSNNRRCGTVVENVGLACGKLRFNTRQGQNLAVKTGSYSSTA